MRVSETGTYVGAQGRLWGRMALCVFLFLGGVWCLTNTAAMNFSAGLQSADSWLGQLIQPSSTLAVDVMVALLSAVVFSLFAMDTFRSTISGLMLAIVLLGFAGFSVKNSLAFGMQERVEKAMRIKANAEAVTNAAKTENENAKERHENHVAFLKEQYKAAKYRADRNKLLEEIREASQQHFDVKVEVVETVMGDPEAEAMANLLGWDIEHYILANQLALALLLVFGKVLGFGLAASLWPRPAGHSSDAVETSSTEKDAHSEAGQECPEQVFSPVPIQASNDLSALESPKKVARRQSKPVANELDRARRLSAVRAFLSSAMERTSGTKDGLTADSVFRAYAAWVRDYDLSCEMTGVAFAKLCTELNVDKCRRGGVVHYGLRPAPIEPVAIAA